MQDAQHCPVQPQLQFQAAKVFPRQVLKNLKLKISLTNFYFFEGCDYVHEVLAPQPHAMDVCDLRQEHEQLQQHYGPVLLVHLLTQVVFVGLVRWTDVLIS